MLVINILYIIFNKRQFSNQRFPSSILLSKI